MRFSLIFFGASDSSGDGDRYELLIDCARFADREGLEALWVPERHFTPEGWLYPNPAVVHAALARETSRIALRAGSVVLPLHHPIRVAEEWSVVDNLSHGRVEIAFASGWHPDDFAFFPDRYPHRQAAMYEAIETVRQLWRGNEIEVTSGTGEKANVRIFPPPIQAELPIWITAAGNPKTFERAGELGAGLLTHLFNQPVDLLEERIALYRRSLERHGFDPASRRVAVMVHAALGEPGDAVEERASAAFLGYLETATGLLQGIASSRGRSIDLEELSPATARSYASYWLGRLLDSGRVLFGSPESRAREVMKLAEVGVDEIALQLDFGLPSEAILDGLAGVRRLQEICGEDLPGPAVRDSGQSSAEATVHLASRPVDDPEKAPPVHFSLPYSLADAGLRCGVSRSVPVFYSDLGQRGVVLGGGFQGLEELWTGPGEALARVHLTEEIRGEAADFHFHPAYLDSCLQVALATLPESAAGDRAEIAVPIALDGFELISSPSERVWSHARLRPETTDPGRSTVDVRIVSDTDEPIAIIDGLVIQRHRSDQPPSDRRPRGRFYRLDWQAVPPLSPGEDGEPGAWIVLTDDGGIGEALAAKIRSRGDECVLVRPAIESHRQGGEATVRPDVVEDLERLLESVDKPLRGVVHLWSLDTPCNDDLDLSTLNRISGRLCAGVISLARFLGRIEHRRPAVWMVTRGAVAVGGAEEAPSVTQALLQGLGTTLIEESGVVRGGLLDLDPLESQVHQVAALWSEIRNSDVEQRVAFRGGERFGLRLVQQHPPAEELSPLMVERGGCHLITGGLGDLGLLVADLLVRRGARRLVLIGRSGMPARERWAELDPRSPDGLRAAAIGDLEAGGAEVRIAPLDVADESSMSTLFATLTSDGWMPVRGVVHAAGTAGLQPLAELTPEGMMSVLRAKVLGGWILHGLLDDTQLKFFLLFSSWASFFGSVSQGLGSYGAANGFLDALAYSRVAAGKAATSVSWGDWAETGLRARFLDAGHRLLPGDWSFPPAEGLDAVESSLGQSHPHLAYLAVDWAAWGRLLPLSSESPLIASLVGEATETAAPMRLPPTRAGATKGRMEPGEITAFLTGELARTLRLERSKVEIDQPLTALGLDSLLALEIAHRIQADLGASVSVGEIVGGLSVTGLTEVIDRRLSSAEER